MKKGLVALLLTGVFTLVPSNLSTESYKHILSPNLLSKVENPYKSELLFKQLFEKTGIDFEEGITKEDLSSMMYANCILGLVKTYSFNFSQLNDYISNPENKELLRLFSQYHFYVDQNYLIEIIKEASRDDTTLSLYDIEIYNENRIGDLVFIENLFEKIKRNNST